MRNWMKILPFFIIEMVAKRKCQRWKDNNGITHFYVFRHTTIAYGKLDDLNKN